MDIPPEETCIFCHNSVIENPTKEHIVLSCLGARFETDRVICCNCNNRLQAEVDTILDNETRLIRNMLGIRNYDKTGRQPPKIKGIVSRGNEYDLDSDGSMLLSKGKIGLPPEVDNGIVKITIQANNESELEQYLEHAKSYIRKNYGELQVNRSKRQTRMLGLTEIQSTTSLISVDMGRAAAKMLIILWAHIAGNAEVNNGKYDELKKYILGGKSAIRTDVYLPKKAVLDPSNPFANILQVVSDHAGHLYGYFQLLGGIIYRFKLGCCTKPLQKYSLVSDPLTHVKEKIENIAVDLDLNDSFFLSFGSTDQSTKDVITNVRSSQTMFMKKVNLFHEVLRSTHFVRSTIEDLNSEYPGVIDNYKKSLLDIGFKIYTDLIPIRERFTAGLEDEVMKPFIIDLQVSWFKDVLPSMLVNIEADKEYFAEVATEMVNRITHYLLGKEYIIEG